MVGFGYCFGDCYFGRTFFVYGFVVFVCGGDVIMFSASQIMFSDVTTTLLSVSIVLPFYVFVTLLAELVLLSNYLLFVLLRFGYGKVGEELADKK